MSAFPTGDRRDSSNRPPDPTQASESLQDEALLRYYIVEWDRYTKGANYINRLFTYLNREWVESERDAGKKGIYPVYTVCPPPPSAFTHRPHWNPR